MEDGGSRTETHATRKPSALQGRKHFTKAAAHSEAQAESCSSVHGSSLSGPPVCEKDYLGKLGKLTVPAAQGCPAAQVLLTTAP